MFNVTAVRVPWAGSIFCVQAKQGLFWSWSVMTSAQDTVRERLKLLDRRLEATKRHFENGGESSDIHDDMMAEVRKRQTEIKQRIDVALKSGVSWALLKAEFELDFTGLFSAILAWQERLDAETVMEMRKLANAAGASADVLH